LPVGGIRAEVDARRWVVNHGGAGGRSFVLGGERGVRKSESGRRGLSKAVAVEIW